MPLVRFTVTLDDRPNPRVISADARAVPAEPYAHLDDDAGNPGGITRCDLPDDAIRPLGSFENGVELFIEGEPEDVLDDTDDESVAASRIWWRARVVER